MAIFIPEATLCPYIQHHFFFLLEALRFLSDKLSTQIFDEHSRNPSLSLLTKFQTCICVYVHMHACV